MITYCRTSLPSLTLTLFSAFVFQLLNSLATDLDCMLSELCTTPDSYKRVRPPIHSKDKMDDVSLKGRKISMGFEKGPHSPKFETWHNFSSILSTIVINCDN
ncbi:uncharacterized protein LOC112456278 isoform X1 [Temnothorax curvispinosus]|uniref:Uncharacterized protein LOC112456278 isoform X1 n=1 Tax=Temnothorax curvispinosus TaxID=300111 RepID=A0A6J1PX08_9HYME|nr:uncharacterized protein LOC112456278 isoform X1 [Temnothorax curvispinosus]